MRQDHAFGTLGRSYANLGILGEGGMATVYRARQIALDRLVALKVLHPRFSNDPDFVTRFIREASVVARLEHPNIVTIYDAGQADGSLFLAMRLVEGSNLADLIARHGPAPLEKVAEIAGQVGAALDFAHQSGIVHRDVKPANILLEAGSRVSLTDFGIAQVGRRDDLAERGVIVGTPEYLAPEVARGEDATPASDRYALGVVVYEMLTGHNPFQGTSVTNTLYRHQFEEPAPLSSSLSGIPREVAIAVATMLRKDPRRRFASCGAFTAVLTRPGIPVTPGRTPRRLLQWRTRPPGEPHPLGAPLSWRHVRGRRFARVVGLPLLTGLVVILAFAGFLWITGGPFIGSPRLSVFPTAR